MRAPSTAPQYKIHKALPCGPGARGRTVLMLVSDVHSEITRDENHNHHYTDDVENIHWYFSSRLTLEKSARRGNRARYSTSVT
jgi:hypothetical protein